MRSPSRPAFIAAASTGVVALLLAAPAAQAAVAGPGCPPPTAFLCGTAKAVVGAPGRLAAGAGSAVGQGLGALAGDAFGQMAQRFGEAGIVFLRSLAHAFVASSTVDLGRSGVDPVMAITLPIAMVVAVLLVVTAAGRAAVSGSGSVLATALVGLAKTVLVAAMVVTVAQVGLRGADELSAWIVERSLGGSGQLQDRLGQLITLDALSGSPALVLLFGLLAVLLALALWVELLFRRVAILLLVAVAPIAATGQLLAETAGWWAKTRTALIQLIAVKPVIALCFAAGFSTFGSASDLAGVIAGFVILGLAALAWPLLARFLTFTTVGGGQAVFGGLAGVAAGFFTGRRHGGTPAGGPAAATGTGYTLALEAENDGAVRRFAGTGAAAPAAGGAAAAAGAALTAAGLVAEHVHTQVASAAADADLAPPAGPRSFAASTAGRSGGGAGAGANGAAGGGEAGGPTRLPAEHYAGTGAPARGPVGRAGEAEPDWPPSGPDRPTPAESRPPDGGTG